MSCPLFVIFSFVPKMWVVIAIALFVTLAFVQFKCYLDKNLVPVGGYSSLHNNFYLTHVEHEKLPEYILPLFTPRLPRAFSPKSENCLSFKLDKVPVFLYVQVCFYYNRLMLQKTCSQPLRNWDPSKNKHKNGSIVFCIVTAEAGQGM